MAMAMAAAMVHDDVAAIWRETSNIGGKRRYHSMADLAGEAHLHLPTTSNIDRHSTTDLDHGQHSGHNVVPDSQPGISSPPTSSLLWHRV